MPLKAKVRERKKAGVLEMLQKHGTIKAAAARAGVSPKSIWLWRAADPKFDEAIITAQDHAEGVLDASLWERALNEAVLQPDGTWKRPFDERTSALLLMFLKKKLDPSFKDTYKAEIEAGTVNFSFSIPKPDGLNQPAALPEHIVDGEIIPD